jgi:hypothetical protein
MKLEISLDDFYSGEVQRVAYDESKGVYADFAIGTSRVVKFVFDENGWNEETARKWIKNRKLNRVYFRRLSDGKVFLNSVYLSAPISKIQCSDNTSEIKDIFGSKVYDDLLKIENRHGSEKPFVVKVVAMDFKGKDFVVANGMKFYREQVQNMIDKFSTLPIRLGHPSMFESQTKRIGNTIGAYVDKDGNPTTYSYIHPHGEAGNFREDLSIAQAQGNLGSFEVSMFGDPVDYETVKDEDVAKEDGAQILLHDWNPTGQDFVDEGAIPGSRAVQVANADLPDEPKITPKKELGGSKVTITEILQALSEFKGKLALSDFLAVDSFRVAFEEHLKVELKKNRDDLLGDEEFRLEVLESCSDETIDKSKKVVKIINNRVEKKSEQKENKVEDIVKIAEANKIELTENQLFMVKQNITGEETEDEILSYIKAAAMFGKGISVTKGIFESPAEKPEINLSRRESHGAVIETIPIDKKKIEI